MTCRDIRELADSYLSDQLSIETNHEILRHADGCLSCRNELEGRRRLRRALQSAFMHAPELRPSPDLARRVGERLTAAVRLRNTDGVRPRRPAARAAVVLATAASAVLLLRLMAFGTSIADPLARDAIGDHRNCALRFRLVRTPVPLEDAARQFDSAYRLLRAYPPDEFSTPDGDGRVIDRHSCTYGGRRFGHVVMRYHGRLVSLLITASDPAGTTEAAEGTPRVIGRTPFGLTALAINGVHHAVMLVGDLPPPDLARLSAVVSAPLAQQADRGTPSPILSSAGGQYGGHEGIRDIRGNRVIGIADGRAAQLNGPLIVGDVLAAVWTHAQVTFEGGPDFCVEFAGEILTDERGQLTTGHQPIPEPRDHAVVVEQASTLRCCSLAQGYRLPERPGCLAEQG